MSGSRARVTFAAIAAAGFLMVGAAPQSRGEDVTVHIGRLDGKEYKNLVNPWTLIDDLLFCTSFIDAQQFAIYLTSHSPQFPAYEDKKEWTEIFRSFVRENDIKCFASTLFVLLRNNGTVIDTGVLDIRSGLSLYFVEATVSNGAKSIAGVYVLLSEDFVEKRSAQ